MSCRVGKSSAESRTYPPAVLSQRLNGGYVRAAARTFIHPT